jgi:hypothetical protein|tara:strand:+ start:282 stop:629 length:348 start_codon:yes stop_codon:yes gene_type:complete
MSWYKQSQSLSDYSITIEFEDRSQIYSFSSKEEAISAAKKIKGERVSDNSWRTLGFIVRSHGFSYDDVFGIDKKKRSLFDNKVNKNRKTYFDHEFGVGVNTRDHYLGDKIPFKEL